MLPFLLFIFCTQLYAGAATVGTLFLVLFVLPTSLLYWVWFVPKNPKGKQIVIPEIIRVPAREKKIEDMDYHMEVDHVWWNLFNCNVNSFLSPYETVLVQLSTQGLVKEQELAHAKIGTCCNRQFEKEYGCPSYSKTQIGWKRFVNFCRQYCPRVNYVVLASLESVFIFFVDFWAHSPWMFKRYINHWVLAYHLMEECEHGHLTITELNNTFNFFEAFFGYLFTLVLVLFWAFVLTPMQAICYFPKKALSLTGLFQFVEYLVTVTFALLYMTYGGLIVFVCRGEICEAEIMKVYRSYEHGIYNPYCRKTGLIKHKVPKYKMKEFEERAELPPINPKLGVSFSARF